MAVLFVVSGAFARADNYGIVSNWNIGNCLFSCDEYLGNGTFSFNGSFTFTDIDGDLADSGNTWTANPSDGELLPGGKTLIYREWTVRLQRGKLCQYYSQVRSYTRPRFPALRY
jgi:hypothetical protein